MAEGYTLEMSRSDLTRLESQLEEFQAQAAGNHREIYGRLNRLERSDAVQDSKYGTIIEKLDELVRKVEALETRPARRWEGVADRVLCTVAAAIVAFLLARMGL